MNAHSQALWGADALKPAMVEHWFAIPGISPEQDMLVAETPDGRLVGYADVNDGGQSKTRFWIDLRLLPEAGPEGATRWSRRSRPARANAPLTAPWRAASSPSGTSSRAASSPRDATS
jgi:hypothetical protein